MKARLQQAWLSRAPRERAVIAALAALLALVLYALLVVSAERARGPLRAKVTALRAQAAQLEQQAIEYGHLRVAPAATTSPTNLLTLVQARVDQAGLSPALLRIDAPEPERVVVVFGAAAFADWLKLIAGLQAQQVRLESCRIEALSTPGLVSVTATVVRAKPQ